MAASMDRFAPGTGAGDGLSPLPGPRPAPARRLRAVLLLEAGRGHARHLRPEGQPQPRHAARRALAAHGQLGRRHHPRAGEGRASGADARPLHPVCRLLALRLAGRAVRDRPHADGRGRLVPDRRHARGRHGARAISRASWAASCAPGEEVTGLRIERDTVRRRADGGRRDRRSTPWSPTWTPSAPIASWSAARRHGATTARATSRPARAWCSISASTAATSTWRTTTSSSRATPRRSSTGSTSAASRHPIPPATSPPRRRPSPAWRREGGEALYVLVHTPYLRPHHDWTAMFPAYRQVILDKLKRTAGLHDIEERIVVERHLTPQRHPRALQGPERRHLRARQPRHVHRRLQARQPQPARQGALPRRRCRPSRAGHADGDDVGLDRRRRAGRGRPAAGAAEGLVSAGRHLPRSRAAAVADARARRAWRSWALWFERFFRRHLNALRRRPLGPARACRPGRPLVVYSNHPAWWDAAVYILLARAAVPRPRVLRADRRGDAARSTASSPGSAPSRLDLDSRRGAAAFLRTGADDPGPARTARCGSRRKAASPTRASARWACAAGVARLAERGARTPRSCRSRSSTPSGPSAGPRRWSPSARRCAARELAGPAARRHGWRGWRRRLAATMDRLAADAITRDPARFAPCSGGQGRDRRRLRRLAARPGRAPRPALRPGAPGAARRDRTAGLAGAGAGGAAGRRSALANLARPARRRSRGRCRPARLVSILIPARDEAAQHRRGARRGPGERRRRRSRSWSWTTARPTAPPRSSAATPTADPRVRLLTAPPLPPGWAGKNHACQRLAEAARGTHLLFVDADVRLAPARRGGPGRRMPRRPGARAGQRRAAAGDAARLGELLTVPMINFLLLGYLPLGADARHDAARRSAPPAASCCWSSAEAYRAVGGHAAVAGCHPRRADAGPRAFARAGPPHRPRRRRRPRRLPDVRRASRDGLGRLPEERPRGHGDGRWPCRSGRVLLAGGHLLPPVLLLAALLGGGPLWPAAAGARCCRSASAPRSRSAPRESLWTVPLHPLTVATALAIQWTALVRAGSGRPATLEGPRLPCRLSRGARRAAATRTAGRRASRSRPCCWHRPLRAPVLAFYRFVRAGRRHRRRAGPDRPRRSSPPCRARDGAGDGRSRRARGRALAEVDRTQRHRHGRGPAAARRLPAGRGQAALRRLGRAARLLPPLGQPRGPLPPAAPRRAPSCRGAGGRALHGPADPEPPPGPGAVDRERLDRVYLPLPWLEQAGGEAAFFAPGTLPQHAAASSTRPSTRSTRLLAIAGDLPARLRSRRLARRRRPPLACGRALSAAAAPARPAARAGRAAAGADVALRMACGPLCAAGRRASDAATGTRRSSRRSGSSFRLGMALASPASAAVPCTRSTPSAARSTICADGAAPAAERQRFLERLARGADRLGSDAAHAARPRAGLGLPTLRPALRPSSACCSTG